MNTLLGWDHVPSVGRAIPVHSPGGLHRVESCVAPLTAAGAALVVWSVGWQGVDVPAHVYRVGLFRSYGWIVWDSQWYGGHYALPYSALFPAFGAALGVYGAAILSAAVAAWAFERLLRAEFRSKSLVPALVFALGLMVPVAIGQFPFLAGEAVGLLALLAAQRRHWFAFPLAMLCGLFSPVSGAFLVLALTSWAIARKDRRVTLGGLALVAALPLAVLSWMFPDPGRYPFGGLELAVILAICGVGLALVPTRLRALRIGLGLYSATAVAVFLIPNPMGGVLGRLAAGFGPALAVAVIGIERRRLLVCLAVPLLVWQASGTISSVHASSADASSDAAYYAPLLKFFAEQPTIGRVEIPFTRDHWETAFVAPRVPLARGWERQLDITYNAVFYSDKPLSAVRYRGWLNRAGVTWVALPDVALDYSSRTEKRLLQRGLGYLHPVWHNAHWSVWQVDGSNGLTTGAAQLLSLQPDGFVLNSPTVGTTTLRLRYTPEWNVVDGRACVRETEDHWTEVLAFAPGRITVAASLTPSDNRCPASPVEPAG